MTGPSEKLTRCPTCGVESEGAVLHEGVHAPGAIDQRDGFGMCAAPKGKAAWAKLDADERKRLQGVMAECRKRIREADNA